VFYLSQSYFQIPKLIRQQATHIWLRKMSGIRDVKLIMSDYSIDLTPKEMWDMYTSCVDDNSFLNISVGDNATDRFKRGYLDVINEQDFKKNDV
jgi:hypothetical protein